MNGTGTRRPGRTWLIPPVMLRAPGERWEGERLLSEYSGDLGLLLWRTVRDVSLWAMTPPDSREGLFAPESRDVRLTRLAGTEIPPAITAPLETIHSVLMLASGSHDSDESVLAVSCLEVCAWARGMGLGHTAVAFAQAGALAAPHSAEAALRTGLSAFAAGEGERAETWLRRAVGVARREKDRNAYAAALLHLADVFEKRGDGKRAERLYRKAYRAGRRFSLWPARMHAAHRLLTLAVARGDDVQETAKYAQYAQAAQRSMQDSDAGGPVLLDVARFWTDAGNRVRTAEALRQLAPIVKRMRPSHRLQAAAMTVRARAKPGLPQRRSRATRAAWALIVDDQIAPDVRVGAALDLAHAAAIGGDPAAFKRAEIAALRLAPAVEHDDLAASLAAIWPDRDNPSQPRGGTTQEADL